MVEQLPEMGLLLGLQPPVGDLPAHEAESRFALLIRRVIRALARGHKALVLFLDDLQWGRPTSVRLLRQLIVDPDVRSTLFIGAYRDSEVSAGHPLLGMSALLRNQGAMVTVLELGPLSEVGTVELVEETMQHDPASSALGALLHEKTGGNPFYLCRLLESLYEDRLIARVATEHRWGIDLEAIRRLPYTDNVLEFLASRLGGLPDETRAVLAVGAVLGFEFRLRDVAAVADLPLSAAARRLEVALVADIIERSDDSLVVEALLGDELDASINPTYRFMHDRVRQAARDGVAEEEIPIIRLAVARLNRKRDLDGTRLFDLVEHTLAAPELIREDERQDYAQLALAAGVRASNAAAFDASLRYLDGAWSLIGGGDWEAAAELTQRVALEGGEAAYVAGDRKKMTAWIGEVIIRSKEKSAVMRAHEIAIQASVAHNELDDAIDRALEVLPMAGVHLPRHPTRAHFGRELVATWFALVRHPAKSLADLPTCDDPVKLAAMRIQLSIMSAAYYAQPSLVPLLAFSLTRMAVRSGIAPESPFGINAWGYVRCLLNDIDGGNAYGEAAMAMNDRLADRRLRHRSRHAFLTHVAFWKLHWRTCRDELRDIHRGCWEGGDVEYAAFAAFMTTMMSFLIGDPLVEVAADAGRYSTAIRSLGNRTALHQLEMVRQMLECLVGDASDITRLQGDIYDEEEMEAVHLAANDRTNLFLQGRLRGVPCLRDGRVRAGGTYSTRDRPIQ